MFLPLNATRFNVGPQGPQGPQGAQGIQGATGPAGVVVKLANVADGSTVANTIAATGMTPVANFAANELVAGKRLRVTGHFVFSCTGTPNLTIAMFFGTGSVLLLTHTFVCGNNNVNAHYHFMAEICVRTAGAAGTAEVTGSAIFEGSTGQQVQSLSNVGPATLDTTQVQSLLMQVTWGTANAANTITLKNFFVEALN